MSTNRMMDEAVAVDFTRNGFAVVSRLADGHTVRDLRAVFDGMIDGSVPCPGTDRALGGLTRQVMHPHLHHPLFKSNPALDRARELSKSLLEIDAPEFAFSMLIYKPPGHPHTTPWHQDLSYAVKPVTPVSVSLDCNPIVQFWLALDDVDETMGCMEFIPGAPVSPLLPHEVASGDPDDDGRLLAIDHPETYLDLSKAVRCPLPAGSATVHGYTTPHYTGPNRSSRGRPAYIFSFANPDIRKRAFNDIGRPV